MAKKAKVWDGSAWQDLVNATQDLTPYSTTAQMNTAIAASAGMTLLNTTAFTAQSAISIQSVFSSTYQNYRIIFQISAVSTNNNVGFQLLSGSTALATGYYYVYAGYSDAGSASSTYGGNQTSTFMVDNNATYPNSLFSFDLSDPFTSSKAIVWSGTTAFVNSSSNNIVRVGGGNTSSTSSYDGIKFITNSGTATGTVRIYGYKNS
jgi:hypothetical protein